MKKFAKVKETIEKEEPLVPAEKIKFNLQKSRTVTPRGINEED